MLFLIYAETNMPSSSDEEMVNNFREKKMTSSSDEEMVNLTRAAPTRKRFRRTSNGDKRNSDTPTLAPEPDDNANDFIKEVTGKRFSITELFRKKGKRGSTGKDASQERDTVDTAQKEIEDTVQVVKIGTAQDGKIDTAQDGKIDTAQDGKVDYIDDSQKTPT